MIKKIKVIVLISLFFNFLFLSNNSIVAEEEEIERLVVGSTQVFSTTAPKRVAIGNPQVADVTNVTNSEITVSAKSPGTTTLVFWDAFGEQSVKIKVLSEDMPELKRRVDSLISKLNLPNVATQINEDEGKILLLGNVKTPQDRERVTVALGALKEKVVDLIVVKEEETMVEIDVQVLELNKGATDTLGFTWPGSLTVTEQAYPTSTAPVKWSTLFDVVKYSRTNFELKLDLLIQEGKARVLSRPRLACQSGKEAELMVGGEKPIFTTTVAATTGATGTTIDYKEYGIKLKIKPTVTEEERIKLALNVEVTELGDTAEFIGLTTARTAQAYPLTKRTASTELYLNDGQTMAIGGLIKQKSEEDLRKFPWLADIPVLGVFFRQRTTKAGGGYSTKSDAELFITLTPTVMSNVAKIKESKKELKPGKSSIVAISASGPNIIYANIIQKKILENLIYPATAKQAGFQGTVKLNLHLSYQGELLEVAVKDSSGYKILDDNAVSAAKSISAYPPFPSSIQQAELWIEIPIAYRLD